MSEKSYKRSVNDLVNYNVPDVDDDYDSDDNNHKKNHKNHHNNDHDDQNSDKSKQDESKKGGNEENKWGKNPVCKILNPDKVYDRDDVLKLLINKDGFVSIISDLRKAYEQNDGNRNNILYVQQLLRDVVFASAIPEALDEIVGRKYENSDIVSRKELSYFMNEILVYLNNSYGSNGKYNDEVVSTMRDSYRDILYKFNKKKVKKLTENIKGMSKTTAKQIAILTAGSKPHHSIYNLLKYLYRMVEGKTDDTFSVSSKQLGKLFKICFGKNNMEDTVSSIMLEKINITEGMSEERIQLSAEIDLFVRDYLEDSDKETLNKIFKTYISKRKQQERNNIIPRRFGDRRSIHPDDYPKLTKFIEDLERKDFSVINYLRK